MKEEIGYSLLHFQKLVKCQVTSEATKRRKVEKKWEGCRVQREKEQAEGDKQNVTQELAALRAPASTDTCLLEDQAEAGRSAPPRGMVSHLLLLSGPTWVSAPLLLSDPGVSPGPDNGPDSGLALVLTSLLIDLGKSWFFWDADGSEGLERRWPQSPFVSADPSPALGCHHVSDDRHCSSRSVTFPRAEARDAQLQTQSHGDRRTTSSSGGETVQVPGSPGTREELSSPEWSPGAENPRAASGSRVFRALHCGSTVFSSLIRPPPSQAWSSLALAPGPSRSIWKKIPLGDIYESSSMSLRKTKFSQEETRFIHGSSWDLSFPFLYRENIS